MSPIDKSDTVLATLAAAVRADIEAARHRASEFERELATLEGLPSDPTMAFIAISIDRAYTALEAAFLRIARTVDETVPTGEAWHASLVHQMTLPLADRRAAVLTSDVAAALEPLRRHRHWLRHSYAAAFAWPKMRDVALTAKPAIERACAALESFLDSVVDGK